MTNSRKSTVSCQVGSDTGTAAAAALGSITETRNTPPSIFALLPAKGSLSHLERDDRWALLTEATRIVGASDKRLQKCRRFSVLADGLEAEVQVVKTSEGKHHYANLMTCESVWSCPVCSQAISAGRRQELQQLKTFAESQGLAVYMITQTVRHDKSMSLKKVLSGHKSARRKFRNRRIWKRIKGLVGLVGTVTSTEVTVGPNGWHVHAHEIIISRFFIGTKHEQELLTSWCDSVEAAGLPRPNERGLRITRGGKLDDYLSKWGLVDELVSTTKEGKAEYNYTPWHLLQLSAWGYDCASKLFGIYARTMKGTRQLVWSDGLSDWAGIQRKSDKQLVDGDPQPVELVARINPAQWVLILRYNVRYQVLALCDRYGASCLTALFAAPPGRFLISLLELSAP